MATSATANPLVSWAAATSTIRPATASTVVAGPGCTTVPSKLAPPPGSRLSYNGSVSRIRPTAQDPTLTVAATELTGRRRSA